MQTFQIAEKSYEIKNYILKKIHSTKNKYIDCNINPSYKIFKLTMIKLPFN